MNSDIPKKLFPEKRKIYLTRYLASPLPSTCQGTRANGLCEFSGDGKVML